MAEYPLEAAVSAYLGTLPFLWLAVPDPAAATSDRRVLETNAIGPLSNCGCPPLDPPSAGWLGRHARDAAIRESGLWNVNHVDDGYDPAFLALLRRYVGQV